MDSKTERTWIIHRWWSIGVPIYWDGIEGTGNIDLAKHFDTEDEAERVLESLPKKNGWRVRTAP